jgi:hypothetical protein
MYYPFFTPWHGRSVALSIVSHTEFPDGNYLAFILPLSFDLFVWLTVTIPIAINGKYGYHTATASLNWFVPCNHPKINLFKGR